MGYALSLLVYLLLQSFQYYSPLANLAKSCGRQYTVCARIHVLAVYRGDRETPVRGANSVIKKLVNTTSVEAVSYKWNHSIHKKIVNDGRSYTKIIVFT
jgi:hypothetical protein